MATPRSVRLEDSVLERLMSFVLRNPGLTASSAMALLVDEGLRMQDHPGIFFQDGPSGRRAKVMGGADVWEIVRAVRWTSADRVFDAVPELIREVSTAYGTPENDVRIALAYYAHFPEDIDARISYEDKVNSDWERAEATMQSLLGA